MGSYLSVYNDTPFPNDPNELTRVSHIAGDNQVVCTLLNPWDRYIELHLIVIPKHAWCRATTPKMTLSLCLRVRTSIKHSSFGVKHYWQHRFTGPTDNSNNVIHLSDIFADTLNDWRQRETRQQQNREREERERANREREEQKRREGEERARAEEERARREREERLRQEAAERARVEQERIKKEREQQMRREAEERARKERFIAETERQRIAVQNELRSTSNEKIKKESNTMQEAAETTFQATANQQKNELGQLNQIMASKIAVEHEKASIAEVSQAVEFDEVDLFGDVLNELEGLDQACFSLEAKLTMFAQDSSQIDVSASVMNRDMLMLQELRHETRGHVLQKIQF
ncbi:hypothetical protein BCR33DRAFT_722204 [Rhizoclosmatium globosum]|uniref:Uncharacterized protein n=1 Tax=Rhizoclosmatium globosum TaxID=329046 RepID=A0A1Y2BMX0_9FUNG|nr:hypothetical protein BCR33DRAFT_722204 [Rhizoclosmatium globosum]|eukprot:ORY36104.1 hypothetical protein BCR33DRAFT_722204 [Rhizoclosmatium globosum]